VKPRGALPRPHLDDASVAFRGEAARAKHPSIRRKRSTSPQAAAG
jgi:hypothetical protein